MQKTTVCAIDFSIVSLNAAYYAADMSVMIGCQLVIFHSFSLPVQITEVPMPSYTSEDMREDAQDQMRGILERLQQRTGGKLEIVVEIREGELLTQLNDYCSNVSPYAVIIGTESATAFERFMGAGKTEQALKKLHWPLFIIPPMAKFRNFRRVGLACDLREVVNSLRAREIGDLISDFRAELHVLHVSDQANGDFDAVTIEESANLQEMIGRLHPKYHFLKGEHVEAAIVDYAEKYKLDVLIIIPKRHGLLQKVFKHSHSKKIVRHARLPILSLHE